MPGPDILYTGEALKTLESVRAEARGRASGATPTQTDHLEKIEGHVRRAMQEITRLMRAMI